MRIASIGTCWSTRSDTSAATRTAPGSLSKGMSMLHLVSCSRTVTRVGDASGQVQLVVTPDYVLVTFRAGRGALTALSALIMEQRY